MCSRLREPNLEGSSKLADSRFESTSFVRVNSRQSMSQRLSSCCYTLLFNVYLLAHSDNCSYLDLLYSELKSRQWSLSLWVVIAD